VLLEGEGRWATTLRSRGMPAIRFLDGARNAMVRNLRIEVVEDSPEKSVGSSAVEMRFTSDEGGEPAIVGCIINAAGRWGTCIHAIGSNPQVVRCSFSSARWGVLFVRAKGRIQDNEFIGLGETALIVIGGAPWVHRNSIIDCGGPGILVAADCGAALEVNEVRDCLSGVRIIGKRAHIIMRAGNRLLHNGLCDDHQLEAPPSVIPEGATATVRSCKPFAFLPKDIEEILHRLNDCSDAAELTILIRAARRHGLWREAANAHKQLAILRSSSRKGPAPSSVPARREVGVAINNWNGITEGYGKQCVAIEQGTLCEILQRHTSDWLLIATSQGTKGWCNPHVIG